MSRRALFVLAVPGVLAVAMGTASAAKPVAVVDGALTICHATSSDVTPYVLNSPDASGDVSGHAGHVGPVWNATLKDTHDWWGDIIPPFTYDVDGVPTAFPGLNWTAAGQVIWDNGCALPSAVETTAPPVVVETTAPPVVVETTAPPVVVETTAPPVVVETTAPPVDPGQGSGTFTLDEPTTATSGETGTYGSGTLAFTGAPVLQWAGYGLAMLLAGGLLLLTGRTRKA